MNNVCYRKIHGYGYIQYENQKLSLMSTQPDQYIFKPRLCRNQVFFVGFKMQWEKILGKNQELQGKIVWFMQTFKILSERHCDQW